MNGNLACLAHLDAGGLVLTANPRQARILRRLHDQAQIAAGRAAWPSAQILPLDAWMAGRWREAGAERADLPVALPPVAMRWLWRQLVSEDVPGLVDAAETASRARASWLQLRAHAGTTAGLARFPLTRDQQAFIGWARRVEQALAARRACDAGELVVRLVTESALPAPGAPLMLVGFSRPTPAQEALFAGLVHGGWDVRRFRAGAGEGAAWRHGASDPDSERDALVAWLRERLRARPGGVHGVVAPHLATDRGGLERRLESALQPELELPAAPSTRVFDVAGGTPLSAQPVVAIAIDAIRFALGRGDGAVASRLLRSAHLSGSGEERESRLRLDAAWRLEGRAPPDSPDALAQASRRAGAPDFAHGLAAAATRLDGPPRRPAGTWAEAFGACLAAWDWPRRAGLGSPDWQASARFAELLRELGAISTFAADLSSEQAFGELEGLAASPFQPESGEPAVFILDGWEEPGLAFDSLWVSGLTATAWPPTVRLDPFLPIEAQRMLGMPRATAEACIAESEAVLASWQAEAHALVLSWPRRENDTDADPSALVPDGIADLPPIPPFEPRAELQRRCAVFEALDGDAAPGLSARAAGGVRMLDLQARCPFRAFGELRLHARPLQEPLTGFDRRLRGQVLHRSLERFWSGLGSQAALLALRPDACRRRAEEAVDEALVEFAPAAAGPRARALERDWQLRAVDGLLALDRERPPFVIVETEREITGRLGGLELRLRVDRVDDTGGRLVVIDYKSGQARGTAWRGARMDAPQLPLYAVLHPRRPAAVALAQAGRGGARYLGVGEEGIGISGVVAAEKFPLTEDRDKGFAWRAITERWWAWLDALAGDHAAGRADVDPKLAGKTCRQCHLAALCRVDPAAARDAGEEEAARDE